MGSTRVACTRFPGCSSRAHGRFDGLGPRAGPRLSRQCLMTSGASCFVLGSEDKTGSRCCDLQDCARRRVAVMVSAVSFVRLLA